MTIIAHLWASFSGWVMGWGGVAALVGILALALWFWTPAFLSTAEARAILLNFGIGCLAFAFVSGYYFTQGDAAGYQRAINEVAARNKEATDAVNDAIGKVSDCASRGGQWDTVTGLCN